MVYLVQTAVHDTVSIDGFCLLPGKLLFRLSELLFRDLGHPCSTFRDFTTAPVGFRAYILGIRFLNYESVATPLDFDWELA